MNAQLKSGSPVFARAVDDPWPNHTLSVAVDSKGDIAVSGRFVGPLGLADVGDPNTAGVWDGGGADLSYLAKVDGKNGARKWGYLTGPSTSNSIGLLAADSVGNVYMAATFTGTLAFPGAPSTMTSAGSGDAFVVKVDSRR